ncbi:MAG: hypothetical protein KOO69_01830 [Victivallales bacterium]|nr:hypothetical protein [Victivallales bacterium]
MIRKNILLGMIVVAGLSFNLNAGIAKSEFYPRKYTAIHGDVLRAQMRQTKNLKWAFCESLTNTVVRTLTRGLRKNNDAISESKTVSWQADRKSFLFKYKAIIKNGIIIREECVLTFSRMPVLRTLNGEMLSSPTVSKRQLSRFLYYLKKANVEVKSVDISVKKDTERAEELLDYLDIEDNSNVYPCASTEIAPQVKIMLK